jgi:peptide/nickel transport system permease protein
MLSGGRDWLSVAWWITTFPGIAIMLAVICINVIGDGLRDALDPRL